MTHHRLWQLGLLTAALALTPACSSKKKDKSQPTSDEGAVVTQQQPAGAGASGGSGAAAVTPVAAGEAGSEEADEAGEEVAAAQPLAEVDAYEPSVMPAQISISFPSFLLNNGDSASLRLQDVTEGEATAVSEDVDVSTDGTSPNGASQLATYAEQFLQSLSGTIYDAMLLDQNWSAVDEFCGGGSWTTCHIPADSLGYTVTPEVIAAVVGEIGGMKEEEESSALRLADDEEDSATAEATEEELYTEAVEEGYEEIYGDIFAEVNNEISNPETFIWLGGGDDNPCSGETYGHGIRFVRSVEGWYNESTTLCFNPDSGATSTSMVSQYTYDYGDQVVTDSFTMTVAFDPVGKRSVFDSSYNGDTYSYETNLTLVEDDSGLTITGLSSYEYDGYSSSMRQKAFVDADGNGYIESDEEFSYFTVSTATTSFDTVDGVWYSIYPSGADPQVVGSTGSFMGNGTTSPSYPYYWGPSSTLTGLDVHTCEWIETTELVEDVETSTWAYECSQAGDVTLAGTTDTYAYRYKEFFGETSGWQVIDPETGTVLYSSDPEFADEDVFAEYEVLTDEAVESTASVTVTATYPDAAMSDLTDDDYEDALDFTYGTFYIARCDGSCPAEVSEDADTYLDIVGYTYLSFDEGGSSVVETYVWADAAVDETYGLYYYDYADINAEGYAKAKLLSGGSVTMTANP